MALSDYYKKKREALTQEREKLAIERAKAGVERLMQTEQFRLSALALPEGNMQVDAIIRNTVQTVLNPVAEFVDTLRAKGYRPAEIRATVYKLYVAYCTPPDYSPDQKLDIPYEKQLENVADYVALHQEIYNTLTIKEREED